MAEKHVLTIAPTAFDPEAFWGKCSCDWESEEYHDTELILRDWQLHRDEPGREENVATGHTDSEAYTNSQNTGDPYVMGPPVPAREPGREEPMPCPIGECRLGECSGAPEPCGGCCGCLGGCLDTQPILDSCTSCVAEGRCLQAGEPRVFFPGDTVPTDVATMSKGERWGSKERHVFVMPETHWPITANEILVELPRPTPEEFDAIVERARAAREGTPPATTKPPSDWTEEDRFADYREAYAYARSHFSLAAHAHAKVDRREAYWIWKTIQHGFDKQARERDEATE